MLLKVQIKSCNSAVPAFPKWKALLLQAVFKYHLHRASVLRLVYIMLKGTATGVTLNTFLSVLAFLLFLIRIVVASQENILPDKEASGSMRSQF